jgi:hypothetical protein
MRVIATRIIIPERFLVKSKNEILITAANRRNILLFFLTYSFKIKKKGKVESRYSAAKLLCPKVEPGGMTEGRGIIFN